MAVWRALLRAYATITATLDAELVAATGLPLDWYDVLLQLGDHGGRLRMQELANALVISPSNCTRLVDRLEVAGLVAREVDAADRRVRWAVLTSEGRRRQRRAAPAHLAGIARHVGARLTAPQAAAAATALERLADRGAVSGAPAG
jgi:DNA-binding MarR family transcriptional regulator